MYNAIGWSVNYLFTVLTGLLLVPECNLLLVHLLDSFLGRLEGLRFPSYVPQELDWPGLRVVAVFGGFDSGAVRAMPASHGQDCTLSVGWHLGCDERGTRLG